MANEKEQILIDAFCEARGYTGAHEEELETKEEFIKRIEPQIQANIDAQRATIQARLDSIPTTARGRMKNIALEHLAVQEAERAKEKIKADNSGVNL